RLVVVGPAELAVRQQRTEHLAVGLEAVRQPADVAVGDALQLGLVHALRTAGELGHVLEDQADRIRRAVRLDRSVDRERTRAGDAAQAAANAVRPALFLAQVRVEP